MHQLIKDNTRITNVIFVTKPDKISVSGVHILEISDHSLIYLIRKNKKIKALSRTIKSRSLKHFNDRDFVDTIKNINWDNILLCSDVDIAWATWKNLFLKACNMHAPYKEKRSIHVGSLPEWINGDYCT